MSSFFNKNTLSQRGLYVRRKSLTKLDADSFDAIVYSSHQDQRPANWLQQHTNKPVIQLPLTVSQGQSLDKMYDQVIDDLLDVLVQPVPVKI